MACNCTDLLNDLQDKFDLIIELINTIIERLARGVRIRNELVPIIHKDDNDILEFITIIYESGLLI